MMLVKISLRRKLCRSDTWSLRGFDAVYKSYQGSFLARRNESFILVNPTSDGFIPREAMFAAPCTNPVDMRGKSKMHFVKKLIIQFKDTISRILGITTTKLSQDLSDYLRPSGQDSIRGVQLRLTDACLLPHGQLNAVFGDFEEGCSQTDEYCLAACDNGTVAWLPHFECVEGNHHVWTVHLFDRHVGEEIHLGHELRRLSNNNPGFVVINIHIHIGGNVNKSGNQNIGGVILKL